MFVYSCYLIGKKSWVHRILINKVELFSIGYTLLMLLNNTENPYNGDGKDSQPSVLRHKRITWELMKGGKRKWSQEHKMEHEYWDPSKRLFVRAYQNIGAAGDPQSEYLLEYLSFKVNTKLFDVSTYICFHFLSSRKALKKSTLLPSPSD